MPTFEEIASRPMSDIKPPPLLPVGTYLVGIIGVPELTKSTQKQTNGVEFRLKFYQARDDVNRDSLAAILDEANMKLSDHEMSDTFWVTERSAFMLKQFLTEVLDIPESYGFKQALPETAGKQFLVHIRHRPRQDGTGLRADIDSRAKAS